MQSALVDWVAASQGVPASQVAVAPLDARVAVQPCAGGFVFDYPFVSRESVRVRCTKPNWQLFVKVGFTTPAGAVVPPPAANATASRSANPSAAATPGQADGQGRLWYLRHLESEPSLVAAAKWIAGERLEHEQYHPQVQRALDHATLPLTRYRCAACGFEARQHFWQCPGCQSWDSYPARRVEEL